MNTTLNVKGDEWRYGNCKLIRSSMKCRSSICNLVYVHYHIESLVTRNGFVTQFVWFTAIGSIIFRSKHTTFHKQKMIQRFSIQSIIWIMCMKKQIKLILWRITRFYKIKNYVNIVMIYDWELLKQLASLKVFITEMKYILLEKEIN